MIELSVLPMHLNLKKLQTFRLD